LKLRAVGDVNGDQWPDLVWQNQVTGLLSSWFMRDFQRLGEVLLSPDRVADTDWRIVGMRYPWDYSGVYTLTVTARSCTSGFPEAAKRRVYTARVEQMAANLRVSLSDADFLSDPDDPTGGGTFTGAVEPTGEITFSILPSSVWDFYAPDLEERLSDGTVLTIFGGIDAVSTPSGISGTPPAFSQESGVGGIFHLPPRGSSWSLHDATGSCFIDRFEMVRR
jgi:hypothetical protein